MALSIIADQDLPANVPLPPPRPTDLAAPANTATTGSASSAVSTPSEAQFTSGERQYLRSCSLIVGDGSGSGLDLSQMRVRFRVHQKVISTPGYADIIVTNLAPATAKRFIQKEFTQVQLKVGYGGGLGLLFDGDIIQSRVGREQNVTDTYTAILATHADKAYNFGHVNTSLAAGHTYRDKVDAVLKALQPYGIGAGTIVDLGPMKSPRAAVLHGAVKDVLREIANATGTIWSIQSGKLQMVAKPGNQPPNGGDVIELNSRTGLIGLPVQDIDGIHARCLMRTGIKPGITVVKINQSSIQQASFDPSIQGDVNNRLLPSLAADGLYTVLFAEHEGDTRGNPWYTDLLCSAKGGALPYTFVPSGRAVVAAENSPTVGSAVREFSTP